MAKNKILIGKNEFRRDVKKTAGKQDIKSTKTHFDEIFGWSFQNITSVFKASSEIIFLCSQVAKTSLAYNVSEEKRRENKQKLNRQKLVLKKFMG